MSRAGWVVSVSAMEETTAEGETTDWFVYMLRCGNAALYTGVTTDVARRVNEHRDRGPLGARYTRAFAPVELVYSCRLGQRTLACRVEHRLKRLPRPKKIEVVSGNFSTAELLDFLGIETARRPAGHSSE